jgi:hypothetical protein
VTTFIVAGQKVLLPSGRQGIFREFAKAGIRRTSASAVVSDVQPATPVLSIPDQEMFDAADVGIPLNDERLRRIANLLDCCFEHMQHLIDGDKDAIAEAKAFMRQMTEIEGVGIHWMREEYAKAKKE